MCIIEWVLSESTSIPCVCPLFWSDVGDYTKNVAHVAKYFAHYTDSDLSKELDAYATAEDYSEELLNNGLANYLEVLTARQNALNSELNYVDSQYARLSAIVELYRALGGGWK